MTSFFNAPRLIKGAMVGVDAFNPLASAVVFCYNQETMSRRPEACAASGRRSDGGQAPVNEA